MTITVRDGWQSGSETAHAALLKRVHRKSDAPVDRGMASIGAFLPLYRASARNRQGTIRLGKPRLSEWLATATIGDRPACVRLKQRRSGWRYTGLVDGPLPSKLFKAAVRAEEVFNDDARNFEPRVLDIPALRTCALWLFTPRRSRFIDLGHQAPSSDLEIVKTLDELVSRRLKAAMAR